MDDYTIDELIQNSALKKWVEEGLEHHHESGICKFCKQPSLTANRLANLKSFFDDDQKKFTAKLQAKANELMQLAKSLDDKEEDTKVAGDFMTEYNTAVTTLKRSARLFVMRLRNYWQR